MSPRLVLPLVLVVVACGGGARDGRRPTDSGQDGPQLDASNDDARSSQDAGATVVDVPAEGAPRGGVCEAPAARCACACDVDDLACMRRCAADAPRCQRCFFGTVLLICCPSEAHGLDECSQSSGCDAADEPCLALRCRAEVDALERCWSAAVTAARCRQEMTSCFGADSPRCGSAP